MAGKTPSEQVKRLGAMLLIAPDSLRREMLRALREAQASEIVAAEKLGIAVRTWDGWVAKLGLEAEIELLKERARAQGWHHGRHGGRPPSGKATKRAATPKRRAAKRASTK